jgi:hypothetical protein
MVPSFPLSRYGIHSLPNELLSYIFLNAVRDYDHPSESAYFPLVLSHTCSRWRKVALSTASLYTSIKLSLPDSSSQLDYLQTWLLRSKSYPLDMLLDFRDEAWDWDEDGHLFTHHSAEHIISLILPHAKRWRHIEFFTDTWAPIHAFLDLSQHIVDLPALKSLALSRCNAYFARKGQCFQPTELREALPLFGGAQLPSLRDLSLVGVHVDWRKSSLVNLLEIEFKFHAYDVMPTLDQFAKILAASPRVQRLSIVGWGPRLDSIAVSSPLSPGSACVISLTKLKQLCFGFVDVAYAVTLLSLFNLPSLSELELEDIGAIVDPMGPSDVAPLLDLLQRSTRAPSSSTGESHSHPHSHSSSSPSTSSGCFFPLHQIDRLELRSLRSSVASFTNFLRCFSTLETIHLADADSALLTALGPQKFFYSESLPQVEGIIVDESATNTPRRRSSFASSLSTSLAPCPQLVDLICRRVDTSVLSSVIEARAKAGSGVRPLRSVQLDLDDGDVSDDGSGSTTSGLSEEDRKELLDSGVQLIINDMREY